MDRINFIEHKGKKILHADYSKTDEKDKDLILQMFEEKKKMVGQEAPGSVLILADSTDSYTDKELQKALVILLEHNKPFVKKSAAVGVTGIRKVIYNLVLQISGRNVKIFNSIEDAKDWLVED